MSKSDAMSEREFAQEVERLLLIDKKSATAFDETLLRIKTIIEERDDALRAHVDLAEVLLESTHWADQDELAQSLLWALHTLYGQGRLTLSTGL